MPFKLRERRPKRLITLLAFAAGVSVRVSFMVSDRPGFVGYPDARTYIIAADRALFGHPCRPAGYPLFLRAVRRLDGRLSFTTATQHMLGVLTASALYFAVKPFLKRPGLALLPAGVVLFGGAQLYLEHSVMPEGPYSALLSGALYCATRTLRSEGTSWWLAASGTAVGVSATLRSSGVLAVPPLGLWACAHPGASPRQRLRSGAAFLVGSSLPLVAYLTAHHAETGSWSLIRAQGLTLYSRMAPIADPARFVAPRGTEGLCEMTDPRTRPNATWYMFAWPEAPALALFGVPPYPRDGGEPGVYRWPADRLLRSFAASVLRAQPVDYLASVAWGLINFVKPSTGPPSAFGWNHRKLIDELHNPDFEAAALDDITSYYDTGRGHLRHRSDALDRLGGAARVEGGFTAMLIVLASLGVGERAKPRHRALTLFSGTTLSMGISIAALLFYDARYAAPLYGPLAAGAALGMDRLLEALSPRATPVSGLA